jgi:hypothetical protein
VSVAEQRCQLSEDTVNDFLPANYGSEGVIDFVISMGIKIFTNSLHGVTQVAIDFPTALLL